MGVTSINAMLSSPNLRIKQARGFLKSYKNMHYYSIEGVRQVSC
jgi:hypothetical protein